MCIISVAHSAALAPSKETPNLVLNSLAKPAEQTCSPFLEMWSHCCPDVLGISPALQQQNLGEAASMCTLGHALQVGVNWKLYMCFSRLD